MRRRAHLGARKDDDGEWALPPCGEAFYPKKTNDEDPITTVVAPADQWHGGDGFRENEK